MHLQQRHLATYWAALVKAQNQHIKRRVYAPLWSTPEATYRKKKVFYFASPTTQLKREINKVDQVQQGTREAIKGLKHMRQGETERVMYDQI